MSKTVFEPNFIDHAKSIFDRVNQKIILQTVLDLPSDQLAIFLMTLDHALDLGENASKILLDLPIEKKTEIAQIIAKTEVAPIETVKTITEQIIAKIEQSIDQTIVFGDGSKNLSRLIRLMPSLAQDELIAEINEVDQNLAKSLTDQTFPFDFLADLSMDAIATIVEYLGNNTIAVALHDSPPEVREKFFVVMDDDEIDEIKDKIATLTSIEKQTSQTARKSIIDSVRRLAKKGVISID